MYYGSITNKLKGQLASLYRKEAPHNLEVIVEPIQQQQGGCDCGLFAAAVCINLALGGNPTKTRWRQNRMREHLRYRMREHCGRCHCCCNDTYHRV